jgi:hypothetical protein
VSWNKAYLSYLRKPKSPINWQRMEIIKCVYTLNGKDKKA